jgi:hypothetical protein
MTTIAANLQGIASDSYVTGGTPVPKILRGRGILVAFAGDAYWGTLLAEWVLAGERGPAPPWDLSYSDEGDKAHETELIILRAGHLWIMDGRGKRLPITREFVASGTGMDMAHAVMHLGHSPVTAVETACEFDSNSKLPVVWEPLKRGR